MGEAQRGVGKVEIYFPAAAPVFLLAGPRIVRYFLEQEPPEKELRCRIARWRCRASATANAKGVSFCATLVVDVSALAAPSEAHTHSRARAPTCSSAHLLERLPARALTCSSAYPPASTHSRTCARKRLS
eukprot:6200929-Pleurochrysis_carterae.AAC.4